MKRTYRVEKLICYEMFISPRGAPEEVSKCECPGPSPGLHL